MKKTFATCKQDVSLNMKWKGKLLEHFPQARANYRKPKNWFCQSFFI